MPLNSISTRIIFFVFLSTFLTSLVISWISIDTIHHDLRSQIEARFPAVLERRVRAIEGILADSLEKLSRAAGESNLGPKMASDASTRELGRSLRATLESLPDFAGLALLDKRGGVLANAGETSWPLDLSEVVATPGDVQSAHSPDGAGLLLTRVSLRLEPGGEAVGALIGSIRHEPIQYEFALGSDEGPGRILLLDAAGAPIVMPDESVDQAQIGLPIDRLIGDEQSRVSRYTDTDGNLMLGHARPLDDLGWVLVVEAPFYAVFSPVASIIKRIFLSDLAVILIFSLLAYKITSTIMAPIEALSEGAARISQGDIEHEIAIPKSNDEISLLTHTFNDMMNKLRQSQNEIEQDKLRLTEQNEELQLANEVLAQLSITDGLTKLHNHRYFQDHLTREIKRLSRTGEPLSMILIDLDDFKRLNDRHGHSAGDEVLMSIAGLMNDSVRESDLLARYGGEEFVILAPNTDLAGAVALAEKMRMNVECSSQIIDDSMRPVRVTISCGVAQFRGDRKRFFQAADRALYQAKADGKNCVTSAEADA